MVTKADSSKNTTTAKSAAKPAVAAKSADKAVAKPAAKSAAKAVAKPVAAAKVAKPAEVVKSAAKPIAKAAIVTATAADNKKRIVFQVNAESGADVFLAGTFNDWRPEDKKLNEKGSGIYTCAMMLPPGTYEYKFRINNTWAIDQDNPNFTRNDLGTLNSVLIVQ